jgi:uncharacterized protein (TIGR00369 family)
MPMKKDRSSNPEAVPQELEQRLRERWSKSKVRKFFSFDIESIRQDYCCMSLNYREKVTTGKRSKGTVHGGIVASLADTASAFALATNFGGRMTFATVDLHVNFLVRAQSKIYAHAQVIRKGSRINVCEVDIVNESGKTVAKATLNFIMTRMDSK